VHGPVNVENFKYLMPHYYDLFHIHYTCASFTDIAVDLHTKFQENINTQVILAKPPQPLNH